MELTKEELRQKLELINAGLIAYCPNINFGGCVHFAYYLIKRLKELKVECKVVLCDRYFTSGFKYSRLYPINHVMVYIKELDCYVDGHKMCKKVPEEYSKHPMFNMSTKKLNYFRNLDGWNACYDVNNNNKIIRSLLKKHL